MTHLHDKLAQQLASQTKINAERIEALAAELISDDVARAALKERNKMNLPFDFQSKDFWLTLLLIALSAITSYIEEEIKKPQKIEAILQK